MPPGLNAFSPLYVKIDDLGPRTAPPGSRGQGLSQSCLLRRGDGVTVLAHHHDAACRQLAGPVDRRFDGVAVKATDEARGHARRRARPL